MRHSLNFCGLSDWLVYGESTLAVNEVCGENSIDQSRFPETCLSYPQKSSLVPVSSRERGKFTNTNNVELKASFQQLSLDLACNGIETDIAPQRSDFSLTKER